MSEKIHDAQRLRELQALPLFRKVGFTCARISEWYQHFGGKVFVSFSGGKDSTVLLYLVRGLYPDVPAVFCNTGLEYPEITAFVKTFDNVKIVRPELSFKAVLEKYGYPVISKDVAHAVESARRGCSWPINLFQGLNPDGSSSEFRARFKKYAYLVDGAPFKISSRCCEFLKEKPLDKFARENKSYPFVGTMASESQRRQRAWEKTGCNGFGLRLPKSKPLSFWTEQDILEYAEVKKISLAPVYGEIFRDPSGKLRISGAQRTGCIYCPFGVHMDKSPNRYERLAVTHPQLHNYCMNSLGFALVLDFLGIRHEAPEQTLINFDNLKEVE